MPVEEDSLKVPIDNSGDTVDSNATYKSTARSPNFSGSSIYDPNVPDSEVGDVVSTLPTPKVPCKIYIQVCLTNLIYLVN